MSKLHLCLASVPALSTPISMRGDFAGPPGFPSTLRRIFNASARRFLSSDDQRPTSWQHRVEQGAVRKPQVDKIIKSFKIRLSQTIRAGQAVVPASMRQSPSAA
jgi:hypothetical protein